MPVIVVCISALLHKDYVTHVTDFGAKLVAEIGLSYTVHYTSSCHHMVPQEAPADQEDPIMPHPCNPAHGFEVTAAEYDAISGSITRVRNITAVRAKTLSAVKVTPDWRFVIFTGLVRPNPDVVDPELNLWVVGAIQKQAEMVAPILSAPQIAALERQCSNRAQAIYKESMTRKQAHRQERIEHMQKQQEAKDQASQLLKLEKEAAANKAIAMNASRIAATAEAALKAARDQQMAQQKAADAAQQAAVEKAEERGRVEGQQQERRQEKSLRGQGDFGEETRPDAGQMSAGGEYQTSRDSRRLDYPAVETSFKATLKGFKNLQVILQPLVTVEHDGDIIEAPANTEGVDEGPVYRMAMAVQCQAELPSIAGVRDFPNSDTMETIHFSQLAVVDFELLGFNKTDVGTVRSALMPINLTLDLEEKDSVGETTPQITRSFTSQCCPRFIPSTRGSRLLFVAEHQDKIFQSSAERPVLQRRLAVANLPTGNVIRSDNEAQPSWMTGLTGGNLMQNVARLHDALLVDVGMHSLPNAPVHGCPEFVPSLYVAPKSITETMMEHFKNFKAKVFDDDTYQAKKMKTYDLHDTFVFTSNTKHSGTVIGVESQVVAASLDHEGVGGKVSDTHLLYNVDAMPDSLTSGLNQRIRRTATATVNEEKELLRLEGCKPIRAAGRKGHMRLQFVFETLLQTLQITTETKGYTTWLACATADQKVAIVQSHKREHWVNFTIPFPVYAEKAISQNVWCPRDYEDECFEVWSSPNPNEMAT